MSLLSLVIFDLTLHVIWDIIEDRVPAFRRVIHQNIINESTDLLTQQIEAMRPTLKKKLEEVSKKEEDVFKDGHGT